MLTLNGKQLTTKQSEELFTAVVVNRRGLNVYGEELTTQQKINLAKSAMTRGGDYVEVKLNQWFVKKDKVEQNATINKKDSVLYTKCKNNAYTMLARATDGRVDKDQVMILAQGLYEKSIKQSEKQI